MTLKKQSIRANQTIYLGISKEPLHKDEVIKLSEEWSETQEKFFVHVHGCTEVIVENDKVSFELEQGLKGLNCVRVKKI